MIPGKSLSFTESQGAPSISVHGSELWDVYSGALTFFRATNSFSAVALRATSSSYLGTKRAQVSVASFNRLGFEEKQREGRLRQTHFRNWIFWTWPWSQKVSIPLLWALKPAMSPTVIPVSEVGWVPCTFLQASFLLLKLIPWWWWWHPDLDQVYPFPVLLTFLSLPLFRAQHNTWNIE